MSIASVFGYTSGYWQDFQRTYPDQWLAFQLYVFPALCLLLALRVGVALGRRSGDQRPHANAGGDQNVTTLQQKIELIYQQLNRLTELISSGRAGGGGEKAHLTQ